MQQNRTFFCSGLKGTIIITTFSSQLSDKCIFLSGLHFWTSRIRQNITFIDFESTKRLNVEILTIKDKMCNLSANASE